MSLFICPICGGSLKISGQNYVCPLGHCYDVAREGYVHLLPANKKHSKAPGDDKNMVMARNKFLSSGLYEPLRRELIALVLSQSQENVAIMDSGCGEGYYTEGIFEALKNVGKTSRIAGIDISKEAVRLAAKRLKEVEFAVASAYHLPVGDESVDMVLNCFSPLCEEEFRRVLRKGGYFIYVVPAPRHLWELKCALYDKPYENGRVLTEYEGFSLEKTLTVESRILLSDRQEISDLFTMTPYFWKTPVEGVNRMEKLEKLETEISFDIHVYRKA